MKANNNERDVGDRARRRFRQASKRRDWRSAPCMSLYYHFAALLLWRIAASGILRTHGLLPPYRRCAAAHLSNLAASRKAMCAKISSALERASRIALQQKSQRSFCLAGIYLQHQKKTLSMKRRYDRANNLLARAARCCLSDKSAAEASKRRNNRNDDEIVGVVGARKVVVTKLAPRAIW